MAYRSLALNCRNANKSATAMMKPTAQTTISALGSVADENGKRSTSVQFTK